MHSTCAVHLDEIYMSDSNVVSSILSSFLLLVYNIVCENTLYYYGPTYSGIFFFLLIKPATKNAEAFRTVQEEEKQAK
jgi:hypothetical protein